MQGGTSSPLPEPPSCLDIWGACGASLRVRGDAWGTREDGLTQRAKPCLTATLVSRTRLGTSGPECYSTRLPTQVARAASAASASSPSARSSSAVPPLAPRARTERMLLAFAL